MMYLHNQGSKSRWEQGAG